MFPDYVKFKTLPLSENRIDIKGSGLTNIGVADTGANATRSLNNMSALTRSLPDNLAITNNGGVVEIPLDWGAFSSLQNYLYAAKEEDSVDEMPLTLPFNFIGKSSFKRTSTGTLHCRGSAYLVGEASIKMEKYQNDDQFHFPVMSNVDDTNHVSYCDWESTSDYDQEFLKGMKYEYEQKFVSRFMKKVNLSKNAKESALRRYIEGAALAKFKAYQPVTTEIVPRREVVEVCVKKHKKSCKRVFGACIKRSSRTSRECKDVVKWYNDYITHEKPLYYTNKERLNEFVRAEERYVIDPTIENISLEVEVSQGVCIKGRHINDSVSRWKYCGSREEYKEGEAGATTEMRGAVVSETGLARRGGDVGEN